MAMEYRATHTEVKERYFTCERCGAFGEVQFQAIGVGYAKEQFWQDDGAERAQMIAADELQVDGDRVYAMIRCPACKQRPKGAFTGMYLRVGFFTVAGLALLFATSFWIWGSLICAAIGAYFLFRDLRRLGRANRAMVYKLTKPEAEERKAKKEKQYKPLRSSAPSQPPRSATAPVVPVRTSAPEIVQPRGPDQGPGFLK